YAAVGIVPGGPTDRGYSRFVHRIVLHDSPAVRSDVGRLGDPRGAVLMGGFGMGSVADHDDGMEFAGLFSGFLSNRHTGCSFRGRIPDQRDTGCGERGSGLSDGLHRKAAGSDSLHGSRSITCGESVVWPDEKVR